MAKGSVRKKGKKWYYRYYVEDASGNKVQKECVGTESKAETERMLRKAIEDYEEKQFVTRTENITLGQLLDQWAEEELKTGTLSNTSINNYLWRVKRIKEHPISNRQLQSVTTKHLQEFCDLLVFGGICNEFVSTGYSEGYVTTIMSVLKQAFRFAVFPKQYISFNPMDYVVRRKKLERAELFSNEMDITETNLISPEQYQTLTTYLEKKNPAALLPIQISYFTGLRIGEVCGLTWQDINLEEQYMVVKRSMFYNDTRHIIEIGPTKRNKTRVVDFCDTLANILRIAKKDQMKRRLQYGEVYQKNYYREVIEKNHVHFEIYSLNGAQTVPADYNEISLVCTRLDGEYEAPSTIGAVCSRLGKKFPELQGFHFHMLRHTYTSNLLSEGAKPKEVQELLGHSNLNTTMNTYAHATRDTKRNTARLLDKVVNIS